MDMTAIGTVTEVLGDGCWGVWHPFFLGGEVSLPMGSGYIHSVIANLVIVFKLGSALKVQGTLHADQVMGVAGKIGEAPATISDRAALCVLRTGRWIRRITSTRPFTPRFTPDAGGDVGGDRGERQARTAANITRWNMT